MMRAYYDRFAEYGWPCTMWSYKTLSDKGGVGSDAWCMATNAAPLPRVDLQNSSYEDLENFFTSLATMPLAVNDRLRDEWLRAESRSMPGNPLILELAQQILESNRTPEEVCADYPELLWEVRQQLKRAQMVEARLAELFPSSIDGPAADRMSQSADAIAGQDHLRRTGNPQPP